MSGRQKRDLAGDFNSPGGRGGGIKRILRTENLKVFIKNRFITEAADV